MAYQLHVMAEGEQGSKLLEGSRDLAILKQSANWHKTYAIDNGNDHLKYVVVQGYRTVYKGKYDSNLSV